MWMEEADRRFEDEENERAAAAEAAARLRQGRRQVLRPKTGENSNESSSEQAVLGAVTNNCGYGNLHSKCS